MARGGSRRQVEGPPSVGIFNLQFTLRFTRTVFLPALPGAVVYGLVAAAAGREGHPPGVPLNAQVSAPEVARHEVSAGECWNFGLRFLSASPDSVAATLARVSAGLSAIGEGPISPAATLAGNFVVTALSQPGIGSLDSHSPQVAPIPQAHIAQECRRARTLGELTLCFTAPLRWAAPEELSKPGHRYMDGQTFCAEDFTSRVLALCQSIGLASASMFEAQPKPKLLSNDLTWIDLGYGPGQQKKKLGGATGRVRLLVRDSALVDALVLGQYVGVGQNTAFGHGLYRIEELGPDPFAAVRARPLIDHVTSAPSGISLDEAWVHPGRLEHLQLAARTEAYEPTAGLRTLLPGSPPRLIWIPDRETALLQRIALARLGPVIDQVLSSSTFAYRRGLGRHDAPAVVAKAAEDGFVWAVRADFDRFFDRIDHRLLECRLAAILCDDATVDLVMKWVRAGAPTKGRGLPTGAPISPMLSNLFLVEFDAQLERKDTRLVRYADDFLVLTRSEAHAQDLLEDARRVAERLQLHLNAQKANVFSLLEPFDFLGFRFSLTESWTNSADRAHVSHVGRLGWHERSRRSQVTSASFAPIPGERELPQEGSASSYVAESPLRISSDGTECAIEFGDGQPARRVPWYRMRELVIVGAPVIDGSVLKTRSTPPTMFIMDREARRTRTLEFFSNPQSSALVVQQVRLRQDEPRKLELTRNLLASKIGNYAALAGATAQHASHVHVQMLLTLHAATAREATSPKEALDAEAAAARAWFRHMPALLPPGYTFRVRHAPNAKDVVNVLLNIGYSYILRTTDLMLRQEGFVSSLGVFHVDRADRPSLAFDFVEPFRFLVDRAMLKTCRELAPGSVVEAHTEDGGIRLRSGAITHHMTNLVSALATEVLLPGTTNPRSYRELMLENIRSARRYLTHEQQELKVFCLP